MKRTLLYICLVMLLSFVSCSQEPVEMNGEPRPIELLALSEYSLDAQAEEATFTVTAKSRYMPECKVDYSNPQNGKWISCSVGDKKSYDTPLNIKIVENKTFQDRSATISVVIRDEEYGVEFAKTISVTQAAAEPRAENGEYPISADENELIIPINTNLIDYTIYSTSKWVTLSKTNGSGNTSIKVKVKTNPNQTKRSTSIYIKSANGEFEVAKITQEAMVYKWSTFVDGKECGDQIEMNAPWFAKEFTVKITTNLDWATTVLIGPDRVESYTKNCDVDLQTEATETEFKFKLKENRSADRRVTFKVYSYNAGDFATRIMVTQSFAPAISVNNDEEGKPLRFEAANYSVGVNTSEGVKWNAQSDADWLTIKTPNGEGSASLEYSVSQNDGVEPRTATISVSLSDYEGAVAEYKVTQNCDNTIHYTAKSKLSIKENVDWGDSIVRHEYDETTQKGYIEFETAPTKVGNSAFYECADLISVKLPKSVVSIGQSAFYSCANLESVTIPNGVTSIGNHAFWGCGSLQSVDIPDGLTSINSAVFAKCTSLKSVVIPDSVTSIEYSAFMDCTGLTSVKLGNGLQTIGIQAFNSCTALTSITIPESVTSIGARAFGYCTGELVINSKIVEVDNVGEPEWLDLNQITKVTIGDNITHIGAYTFYGCTTMKSVNIPNSVTSIGAKAFVKCRSLESINISSSVTSIGTRAFTECTGELFINSKIIESDSQDWFYNTEITKVTIGENITKIGNYAFNSCSSLTSVTIPNSVTSIGDDAFYGCSSLTSVTIGRAVTSIGNSAFESCYGLTSVTIPDSVTSIGNDAFNRCSSLTSVTMGKGVTSIGQYAFSGCTGLTMVKIPNLSTWCKIDFGDYTSNPLYNEKAALYHSVNPQPLTDIEIPADITEVKPYAFAYYKKLESVTLPDGLTSIDTYAFDFCTSLKEVYCKPITPPTGNTGMFYHNANGRKIYVPTDSVNAYKKAKVWSEYSSYIVGYDF